MDHRSGEPACIINASVGTATARSGLEADYSPWAELTEDSGDAALRPDYDRR